MSRAASRFLAPHLVGLVIAFLAAVAAGGELDPTFARRLAEGDPDGFFPAVVMLSAQVDLAGLDRALDAGNAPRALRHRLVIEALRAMADATQPDVRQELRDLERRGEVRNVSGLWIVNALLLEARPAALAWIAAHDGVAVVHDGDVAMGPPPPLNATPGEPFLDAPTPGLVLIKADKLWAAGITGTGSVVANIDTGVDASHPALQTRWRGNTVPAARAWFDPVSHTLTPTDPPYPMGGHGTHTMGTMCGDDGLGKQIGVAPGATWIAVGLGNPMVMPSQMMQYFLQSLQWIADPDGWAGTVADAPDVVSNSWGFTPGYPPFGVPSCDQTLWAAIDACEAAGVAVVFAAGNFQTPTPGQFSIPADRVTSPTNAFSIGAVNPDGQTVASFSAVGPSPCDNRTIKPEVVAPGVQVESSLPGGLYSKQDGTSMATPHVAGAIALLRQVNPDISATRVKEILMETATDLGLTGEDNSSGHGLIDLEAALSKVRSERGTVQVSLVTTTPTVKRPGLVWLHLSATNFTTQAQTVIFQLDLLVSGKPFANLIPPIAPVLPAGFSLARGPATILLPAPVNVPGTLIGAPLTFRATLRQNQQEISRADAVVTLQ
ncbi:MAG: S8 family serine peptidase [Planctomycetes bacterium]|nr:S8 family serine peptidase [Planctomycetota bacterium]